MATPRVKRNRRPVAAASQVQPPLIDWNYLNDSSNTLTLLLSEPMQLTGTPGFVCTVGPNIISVDQPEPNELLLTFDATLPAEVTITLGAYDPAARTPMGGYLVPGTLVFSS